MQTLGIASLITLLAFSMSSAATIHVDWSGGGDHLTIQAGVTAVDEGDTVLVAPGTYTGPENRVINFGGTNIVLASEAGAENTIIDCENLGVGVLINSGEDSTSVVRGFTITRGSGGNGGGIQVSHASAIIEDCIFYDNTAASNGGGLYYGYTETPGGAVRNCAFFGNSAPYRGGGIDFSHCSSPNEPRVTDCIFYDNDAGSGGSHGGGGIYSDQASIIVTGCTLVRNTSSPGAGGIHGDSGTLVTRTVIAFSTEGEAMGGNYSADHCVIFGNAGGDTLWGPMDVMYQDPLFCDIDNYDFTLCANSPCLPGNNSWTELIGIYDQGCGNCDAPVEAVAWSSIKHLFR